MSDTIREAAKARCVLSGADAQALEGALQFTESQLDAVLAKYDHLNTVHENLWAAHRDMVQRHDQQFTLAQEALTANATLTEANTRLRKIAEKALALCERCYGCGTVARLKPNHGGCTTGHPCPRCAAIRQELKGESE